MPVPKEASPEPHLFRGMSGHKPPRFDPNDPQYAPPWRRRADPGNTTPEHLTPTGRTDGNAGGSSPRDTANGSWSSARRAAVEAAVESPGEPLPSSTRRLLEGRLGADLRGARIHTGAQANSAADALGAEAFTSGPHMVFAAGAYAPHTGPGQALLAHEVSHVLQQRTGFVTGVPADDGLQVSDPHGADERAADSPTPITAPAPGPPAGRGVRRVQRTLRGDGTPSSRHTVTQDTQTLQHVREQLGQSERLPADQRPLTFPGHRVGLAVNDDDAAAAPMPPGPPPSYQESVGATGTSTTSADAATVPPLPPGPPPPYEESVGRTGTSTPAGRPLGPPPPYPFPVRAATTVPPSEPRPVPSTSRASSPVWEADQIGEARARASSRQKAATDAANRAARDAEDERARVLREARNMRYAADRQEALTQLQQELQQESVARRRRCEALQERWRRPLPPPAPTTSAELRRQAATARADRESRQLLLRLHEEGEGKRPASKQQRLLRLEITELENRERRLRLQAQEREYTEWQDRLGQIRPYEHEPYYSQTSSGSHLVHRGDVRIEIRNGQRYVRVYQTVYAPYDPQTGRKDVQQDSSGRIRSLGSGDVVWLNAGRPMRALYYVRSYVQQGQQPGKSPAQPVIRSWLIPENTYEQISSGAISEWQVSAVAGGGDNQRTMNVDAPVESDQYGVTGPDVQRLFDDSLPGSLRTYVPPGGQAGGGSGEIVSTDELLAEIGMPSSSAFPELTGNQVPALRNLIVPFGAGGGQPLPLPGGDRKTVTRPNEAEEHRVQADQYLANADRSTPRAQHLASQQEEHIRRAEEYESQEKQFRAEKNKAQANEAKRKAKEARDAAQRTTKALKRAEGFIRDNLDYARQEEHLASLLERLDRMRLDDPARRDMESAATYAWLTMYARDVYAEGKAAGAAAQDAGKEMFPTFGRHSPYDTDPDQPGPSTSGGPQ